MQNKKSGSILVLGEAHVDPIAGHLALQMAKACNEKGKKFVICYEYPVDLKNQEVVEGIKSRVEYINTVINTLTQFNFIIESDQPLTTALGYPQISKISAHGLGVPFFTFEAVASLILYFNSLKNYHVNRASMYSALAHIMHCLNILERQCYYDSTARLFDRSIKEYFAEIVTIDKDIANYNQKAQGASAMDRVGYTASYERERIEHMVGSIMEACNNAGDDVVILVICGVSHARRLAANLKIQECLSHMHIESMACYSQYTDLISGIKSVADIYAEHQKACESVRVDDKKVKAMYKTTPCEIFGDGVEYQDGSMSSEAFTRFMYSALRALQPTEFYIPDWNVDKAELLKDIGGKLLGVETGYAKISVLSSTLLKTQREVLGILRNRVHLIDFYAQRRELNEIEHITIEDTPYANKVLITYPSCYNDKVVQIVDYWSDYKKASLTVLQDRSSWRIGALASAAAVSLAAYIGRSEIMSAFGVFKNAVFGSYNQDQDLSRDAN